MWEYRKEIIDSKEDIDPKDIIKELDNFGSDGWEVFSLTEKYESYSDVGRIIYYTLYMKRPIE